ncbi:MAG: hypothetical protein Q9M48_00330 [Rhodobacterales bacterium]|nr:hypothetical protein [Rhodobacterales bacterium]
MVIAACIGVGWIINSVNDIAIWPFTLFGIAIAALIVLIFPWLDQRQRRVTRYALTNRRAFINNPRNRQTIAQDQDGWVINDPEAIILKSGPPDTVFFASKKVWDTSGSLRIASYVDIGFLRIEDGKHVFELLQNVARENNQSHQGPNDT